MKYKFAIDRIRKAELGTKGESLTCPKCGRPVSLWPLKRTYRCSPPSWVYCIRELEPPTDEWVIIADRDSGLTIVRSGYATAGEAAAARRE